MLFLCVPSLELALWPAVIFWQPLCIFMGSNIHFGHVPRTGVGVSEQPLGGKPVLVASCSLHYLLLKETNLLAPSAFEKMGLSAALPVLWKMCESDVK